MFKKIFMFLLSLLAISSCVFGINNNSVFAEKKDITYVAFGDSIAEGYAINLKSKTDEESLVGGADSDYSVVDNCYVDLVYDELQKTYNTSVYNYAYSGDTCQDMLNFLAEFYDKESDTVKSATESNATYPSLTNQQVYDSVKNANIITVCIGANNILQDAPDLIKRFLGVSTPTIERAEMEEQLQHQIIGYEDVNNEDNNIKGFSLELEELLNTMYQLNPNANVYFTNVYNPYKVLKADSTLLSSIKMIYNKFTQDNLDIISEVTELAVSGGTDSSGEQFTGLNQVLSNKISEFNKQNSIGNFKIVDSKSLFDGKYNTDNETAYNNYVNTQLEAFTTDKINISQIMSGNNSEIQALFSEIQALYLDPHPTYEGHKFIFTAHQTAGIEPYIEQIQFDVNILVNNQQLKNSYQLEKGEQITFRTAVEKDGYTFTYLYKFKQGDSVIKEYTAGEITINYSELPVGEYDVCLTIVAQKGEVQLPVYTEEVITQLQVKLVSYTISFETNCDDVLNPILVVEGGKITQPEISKDNYILVGWFKESTFETQWNFDDGVTESMKLYAKWEENFYTVTFNYNGGLVGEETGHSEIVIKNTKLSAPSEGKTPSLPQYKFVGWFVNLNDETPYDFNSNVTANLTLYAKWEREYFNVTLNYNGGILDGAGSAVVEVKKGECLTEPKDSNLPVKEDYKVVGWYKEANFENLWNFETPINQDITLFAKWELAVRYVTLNYNGGTKYGEGTSTIKVAKGGELQEPPHEGIIKTNFIFKYWYLEDENTPATFPIVVEQDFTVYIFWEEIVNVVIRNLENSLEEKIQVAKGTKFADLYNIVRPTKKGTTFLAWCRDHKLSDEYPDETELTDNVLVYVKWVTLICTDEELLLQAYNPMTKSITWSIDAKAGSSLVWLVNGEEKGQMIATSTESNWVFKPSEVGEFTITCKVDDVVVNGKTVSITYSIPSEISISISRVKDKRIYYIQVENSEYYDPSKFVWYKTTDSFSNDFSEEIGNSSSELIQKFGSDCKVCVKYLQDGTSTIVSNVIDIKVDDYLDETTIISIVVSCAIVAIVVLGVVISRKRYQDFF